MTKKVIVANKADGSIIRTYDAHQVLRKAYNDLGKVWVLVLSKTGAFVDEAPKTATFPDREWSIFEEQIWDK